jgi:hypothetical protein
VEVNWGFFPHALEVRTPDLFGKQSRPAYIHAIEITNPRFVLVAGSMQFVIHGWPPDQALSMPKYSTFGEPCHNGTNRRLTHALP